MIWEDLWQRSKDTGGEDLDTPHNPCPPFAVKIEPTLLLYITETNLDFKHRDLLPLCLVWLPKRISPQLSGNPVPVHSSIFLFIFREWAKRGYFLFVS